MPAGSQGPGLFASAALFTYSTDPEANAEHPANEFIFKKVVKKVAEKTVEVAVFAVGFAGGVVGELLIAPGPLGEGEERALDAQFAQQRQEAIARGEQLGALASDVSTSDP